MIDLAPKYRINPIISPQHYLLDTVPAPAAQKIIDLWKRLESISESLSGMEERAGFRFCLSASCKKVSSEAHFGVWSALGPGFSWNRSHFLAILSSFYQLALQ